METTYLGLQLPIEGLWYLLFFFGISLTILRWALVMNLPLPLKLLALYALLSALFYFEYPRIHFGAMSNQYKLTAAQSFVEMLFVPFCAVLFAKQITKFLPWFVGVALISVWLNQPGFLNAPSFNSAFAVLAMSFCPAWLKLAVAGTVVTHHGSTAVLMLAAQVVLRLWRSMKRPDFTFKRALGGVAILSLLLFSAYHHSGTLFDGGERLAEYREFVEPWLADWRQVVFGVGPGSFMWKSIVLNLDAGRTHGVFLQMHSDWLQILWELGVVGFVLAVWTLGKAVKMAWAETEILSALFSLAVFALTYHPLRFFPTALLTAYVLVRAFSYRKDSTVAHPPY